MGKLDKLYAVIPVWAQNTSVSLYGYYWRWLRFGAGYQDCVREYTERERFRPDQWQAWQQERTASLLRIAAERVPYYRDTWNSQQKEAARRGILSELPLLSKDPLRADPNAFARQENREGRILKFHTSGSTGTPITTLWTIPELRNSMALREARSARWAGVSFSMPRATFSGRMVEPNPESSGPFHRFNSAEKQVYFSAFHLRKETAPLYVEALSRHDIQWLTGYAVSYYLLARFILESHISVPPLKALITTSEKVTQEMRVVMEQAYGCRVFEEYSTVENAVFASECEQGRLHVSPDACVLEILRPDGAPCDPGEVGEVVATCLFRTYQPLIRYRLGDMAVWDPEPCPCGRAMPVIKEVVGRIEDVVIGPDGRQMVRFHGIFVDQPHVREGQIVQERLNHFRVRVVPTNGFGPADRIEIVQRMKQRLGPAVEIEVEVVESIPRTPSGKFRAVICQIPPEERPQ